MESRIEAELRGRERSELTNLNLDGCKATDIVGLDGRFINLHTLSMINMGLTSLAELPALHRLKRLDLADNRITGELEHVKKCPVLTHLNLSGNKIADIQKLAPLADLTDLVSLDLYNCEVSNTDNYRQEVFKILPQLKYLDGSDVNDEEPEWDEDDIDEDESEDESDDSQGDEETSEVGLEYLESSNIVEDEDETEDFALVEDEGDVASNSDSSEYDEEADAEEGGRGTKRKHEDD